ncbi:substrate-binding domain-containing protein [Oleidesulfovibrio alaskensis]|nr:substrate-binding domain-containing protein [Oleidesulfovibrio alaskensis]MBG0773841.1 substrate-binding domain-containing protein [Oleidesulfovibrio alaskensis]MBL3581096.1 substrate-binding domain-containing protein [Oleidesulfovibrio alaskensis]
MKKLAVTLALVLCLPVIALAADCTAVYGDGSTTLKLATGSPGELGLLEELAGAFNAEHDTTLCWVKAGSGKSLKLLHEGDVDLVMVHAPAAEKKAVQEGWAGERTLIGSNEFYIVGPENDPADIASAASAADAYARIASAQALFFSRGDNSGTHKKELAIWKQAGVAPQGAWYTVTGDFMQATLLRADAEKGYFMTDSSTWVATKKEVHNLKVLFRGDIFLVNTYHALLGTKGHNAALADSFIKMLGSDKGQQMVRDYGKDLYGEGMYNDAEYAAQYDH